MGKIAFYMGPGPSFGPIFIRKVMEQYPDRIAFIETQGDDYVTRRNPLSQALEDSDTLIVQHTSEEMTIDRIAEYNVTTVVLVWWPKIVKKINNMPGVNVINTHPAYLPYNRGKHPYYWAVMDNTPFGATIHRVDGGIDTGSILWRKEVEIKPTDQGSEIYLKASRAMGVLLTEHMEDIVYERFPPGIRQDEGKATYHHSSEFELPPIKENEMYDGWTLIQDCRARTFRNNYSGRRIEIDGKMYRVHLKLVEENEDL